MPFVIACPACGSKLKSASPVAAGRSVTCPQCKHAFTTTEDAVESADTGSTATTPRPPLPTKGMPPLPPSSSTKSKVVQEEELQDAEFVDDDEEVEERPKKRRRDDDDDDRPRSKRRRDEDDDDDRPRSRRRRNTDEDESDRPRRDGKVSRKGGKKSLVLLLAIGIPVLLFGLGGCGFGLWYFVLSGGSASTDMLVWAPNNSDSLAGMKVSRLSNFPSLKRSAGLRLIRTQNLIGLDEIDEVLVARGAGVETYVIRSKATLDESKIIKAVNAKEQTVNSKKYYQGNAGFFHFASSRLLIFCSSEPVMGDLLKKANRVTISDTLHDYASRASGDIWNAKTTMIGFAGSKGEYGGVTINTASLSRNSTAIFNDESSATMAYAQMKGFADLMKNGGMGKQKFITFDVTQSGTKINVRATAPLEDEVGLFEGF